MCGTLQEARAMDGIEPLLVVVGGGDDGRRGQR